jgi:hypothetical protein
MVNDHNSSNQPISRNLFVENETARMLALVGENLIDQSEVLSLATYSHWRVLSRPRVAEHFTSSPEYGPNHGTWRNKSL